MNYSFAIIGCGNIAQRHADQILRVGKLVAVCDIDPAKAEKLAHAYGAKVYFTLSELLKMEPGIDIVSICTPNYLHASQSIECLRSGKHVLCEKPLCLSPEDAEEMIQVARETGKKLWIVKQNRYNPPVVKLKELLDNRQLGVISSFQINCFWNRPDAYFSSSTWKGQKNKDGGALYTQFSHFIDLLIWLLGDVRNIQAITANHLHPQIETEDCGMALLEMENGSIGTLHYTLNAFQQNMEGSITLFGSNGTIKIGGQYLNELSYRMPSESGNPLPPGNSSNDYGFYQGSMSNHHQVYDLLINNLETGSPGLPDATEGAKSVALIHRFYELTQNQPTS